MIIRVTWRRGDLVEGSTKGNPPTHLLLNGMLLGWLQVLLHLLGVHLQCVWMALWHQGLSLLLLLLLLLRLLRLARHVGHLRLLLLLLQKLRLLLWRWHLSLLRLLLVDALILSHMCHLLLLLLLLLVMHCVLHACQAAPIEHTQQSNNGQQQCGRPCVV
jgi:hypothetical protein